jgi:single-strand DNA-binding protein
LSEINVAISREYSVGGDRRKDTTFVDVTLWRRQAEIVCQYMKKGRTIFIEGRLQKDSWETPDGQKRSRMRVVADNFQFVGGRGEGDSYAGSSAAAADEPYGSYGGSGHEQGGSRPGEWGQAAPPPGRAAPPNGALQYGGAPPEGASGPAQAGEDPLGLEDEEVPF